MGFFERIFGTNNSNLKSNKKVLISDVKPGDLIQIEWYRFSGGIGYVKCLNNCPETRKIFIQVRWSNYQEANCLEIEKYVFYYSDKEFNNFSLLNSYQNNNVDTYIDSLSGIVNDYLETENYEAIQKLQKKINSIFEHDEKS